LVELLVVILIISILLTLGATAIRGAGGKGTSAAVASTEAIFAEARELATGRSTYTRVLVDVRDSNQESSFLRRIALAEFVPGDDPSKAYEADGSPKDSFFELSARGYTFPSGTFFSREYSSRQHGTGSDLPELTLTNSGGAYNGRWLYYEFNPQGICTTGALAGGDYEPPSFVVGAGALRGDDGPVTTSEARRDFQGFLIWRNGGTSVFRDPEQIFGGSPPESGETF